MTVPVPTGHLADHAGWQAVKDAEAVEALDLVGGRIELVRHAFIAHITERPSGSSARQAVRTRTG